MCKADLTISPPETSSKHCVHYIRCLWWVVLITTNLFKQNKKCNRLNNKKMKRYMMRDSLKGYMYLNILCVCVCVCVRPHSVELMDRNCWQKEHASVNRIFRFAEIIRRKTWYTFNILGTTKVKELGWNLRDICA